MDNRKENIKTLDEGIELMEQNSRHGQHPLDRAIEAVTKFGAIFDKGGGHCEPEAQDVPPVNDFTDSITSVEQALNLRNHGVLTRLEYEHFKKNHADAGIPLCEPETSETSADKISALCDELQWYVLHKHDITDIKEIGEVADACQELKRFLLVKNERYGDSALNPIKVFSKGTPGDKIDTRMDDKISRIIESDEQRMNDFVDLTGYLVLKCIDKGWTDFSDLLD